MIANIVSTMTNIMVDAISLKLCQRIKRSARNIKNTGENKNG